MVNQVFATVDEAMSARRRGILLYVRIGGVAVRATEAHTIHDVGGIGQATVYLPKPAPDSLAANAELEIEIGHPGTVRRRFRGYIPSWKRSISDRGHSIRVVAVGQLSYLNYADSEGTSLPSSSLKDVFRSLCEGRNVDTYFADDTFYPNGDPIILGGNAAVDGGEVRFGGDTSPNAYLQEIAPYLGYRVHDAPDGAPRLSRVSGAAMPSYSIGSPSHEFVAGDWISPLSNVSARNVPGGGVIGVFFAGDVAKVLDGPVVNDILVADNHWYYVRVLNGPNGWVAARKTAGGGPNMYPLTLTDSVFFYDEGENIRGGDYEFSREKIVTFVEMLGRSYTETDGTHTELRSIPADVPANDYIAPQDYIHKRWRSQYLVTAEQTEGARNVKEVDLSAPEETFVWRAGGRPDVMPADIAVLTFPTWGIENRPVWITRLADDVDAGNGYSQTFTGWAGGGELLPAGEDCDVIPIFTNARHMGNETIAWYADPSPNGEDDEIAFTNPYSDFSSLKIEGLAHGSNTYATNTASTGSVIEVWQKPDPSLPDSAENELRRIGSVELPSLAEEYSRRRPYAASDTYWTPFALPIGGRLKSGAAVLKLIAGTNPGGVDDYEVKSVNMVVCGVGLPTLPGSA